EVKQKKWTDPSKFLKDYGGGDRNVEGGCTHGNNTDLKKNVTPTTIDNGPNKENSAMIPELDEETRKLLLDCGATVDEFDNIAELYSVHRGMPSYGGKSFAKQVKLNIKSYQTTIDTDLKHPDRSRLKKYQPEIAKLIKETGCSFIALIPVLQDLARVHFFFGTTQYQTDKVINLVKLGVPITSLVNLLLKDQRKFLRALREQEENQWVQEQLEQKKQSYVSSPSDSFDSTSTLGSAVSSRYCSHSGSDYSLTPSR
ncbi:MAG: hypothetical protein AAF195_02045, partial [Pseudomonadota bacterium]